MFQINDNTTIETGLKLLFNNGMPITPLLAGQENADGFLPTLDNSVPFSDRIENVTQHHSFLFYSFHHL